MSHRHTVIEPAEGLTVLVGPNNCGKSAVVTALQILAYNDNSTYVMRHGEKTCDVTVFTDDGHEITWQRKNNSTSYTIDGKLFDRLRSGVPEELKQSLKLNKVDLNTSSDQVDIHFGVQKQPVFLINEPGRTAAGFFAASSDASRLIEIQKVHKERTRSKKQDARRLETETEQLQNEVNKLAAVDVLAEVLRKCQNNKLELDESEKQADHLRRLIKKIQSLSLQLRRCVRTKNELDRLPNVPELAPSRKLAGFVEKARLLVHKKQTFGKLESATHPLTPPPDLFDTKVLRTKISELVALKRRIGRAEKSISLLQLLPVGPELEDLSKIRNLLLQSTVIVQRRTKLCEEDQKLAAEIHQVESEIDRFVESHETCPTCLQPLDRDHVQEHLKSAGAGREE